MGGEDEGEVVNDLQDADQDDRPIEGSSGEVIEFRTYIRDRAVSCRWSAGRVTGDPELLRRIERSAGSADWRSSPCSVADAVSAAVASPVVMHVFAESGERRQETPGSLS